MTFEIKEAGAGIRLPFFIKSGDGARENENTERMNKFYSTVAAEIESYTASESYPQGARYRSESLCTESDGKITVTVQLFLHHRGRCINRRKLCHTWQDGVII